jgi:5-(aminomethyl)-3-furanmethanol phosphate kinase
MIVIKLGGSLMSANTLLHCLNRIEQQYRSHDDVVIVTGGGTFADQVRIAQRHWQFNDECAHAMAILAMQQMAWLVKGLKTDFELVHSVRAIQQHRGQKVLIWSPDIDELNNAGIAATWDITSDSLAAWLANTLSADELIVIKSAVINETLSLAQLAERGIIDNGFCERVANSTFTVRVINQQDF